MRPVTLALVVLALLTASAEAKELASARACDGDGCNAITAERTLRQMAGGAPAEAPAAAAPFHRVRMTIRTGGEEDHTYGIAYVPSSGLARYGGEGGAYEWLALTPAARRGFERLVRGLEPLPARRLRGTGAGEPAAQVHKVVSGAAFRDDDGGSSFPWLPAAIAGALALALGAAAAVRGRAWRPRPRPGVFSGP